MNRACFRFYAELNDFLPPRTRDTYDEFHACETCGQVYWKGSHYRRMERFVERVVDARF